MLISGVTEEGYVIVATVHDTVANTSAIEPKIAVKLRHRTRYDW